MTLQQFYDALEDMRKIYPFEADKTYLVSLRDPISNTNRVLNISTTDSDTGVEITLSKRLEEYWDETNQ